MKALTASVSVVMSKPKHAETLRVAGLLDDAETVAVATMRAGADKATQELSFTLAEGVRLAEACLAGNERALTTPGLARILASTTAILFRVSVAGGCIQQRNEDAVPDGHCND